MEKHIHRPLLPDSMRSKLGKNGLKTEFCKAARDAQEASDEHSLRSGGSGDDLSPYEKARLKRIESNRAELERLDIKSAVKATTGSVPRSRPKKRNKDDDATKKKRRRQRSAPQLMGMQTYIQNPRRTQEDQESSQLTS